MQCNVGLVLLCFCIPAAQWYDQEADDPGDTIDPGICEDRNRHCKAWARRGECTADPEYMVRVPAIQRPLYGGVAFAASSEKQPAKLALKVAFCCLHCLCFRWVSLTALETAARLAKSARPVPKVTENATTRTGGGRGTWCMMTITLI